MERRRLGELEVSAIGLGCMSMTDAYGPADPAESEKTLLRALEIGVTFFDTANVYGLGRNEELVGRVLAPHRDRVQLSTKFGFTVKDGKPGVDGHPDRIAPCCDESLRRLDTEWIDLYFMHRPDPDVPIEESVGAMSRLVEAGKVRAIGLCEVSSKTIRRAHATWPIAAIQSEYSLWTRDPEKKVLPCCAELGIGFVPFSPIGRAILSGKIEADADFSGGSGGSSGSGGADMRASMPRFQGENLARNLELVAALEAIATERDATPSQLALAWLLARGENVVPIPGTKRRRYLEENAGAADLALDAATIERLDALFDPERVAGERYGHAWQRSADAGDDED